MTYDTTTAAWIRYLDEARQQSIDWKRRSFDHLRIKPGHCLLDVGCGTGDDVRALAERVGDTGEVVGVDNDAALLEEARQRTIPSDAPVRFVRGDVYALPFDDHTFDGCRAERLFQHLNEPERALREMKRVTRPGGRIAVVDMDFDTLVVDSSYPAFSRAFVHFGCDEHARGQIGRKLYGLFKQADFTDVTCEPMAGGLTEWPVTNKLLGFETVSENACNAGLITDDERERWLTDLRTKGDKDLFFASITAFCASGTRKA